MNVERFKACYMPCEGLDLNGGSAEHDGQMFVRERDFDRVTAERDALQQLMNARDEEVEQLRDQLSEAQLLAAYRLVMLDERNLLLSDIYTHNELSLRDNERIESALSASAGHRAPVEIDERAEFEVIQVFGFPSYSVSSDGLVYRKDSGNAVAQQANAKGYMTVNLSEGGEATRITVHRVVLESFIGLRPEGMQARHKDGNPANNRISNLKWGSPSENEADKATHGTKANGSRNGASRLTEEAVREILEAKQSGGKKWGAGKLAKKFGVDISTVVRAGRGKHWSAALERKS
jgi:hypothetical protein